MPDEKIEEKEMEKREEKEHQDAVSAIVGATFLIWIGVVLLATNLDFLRVFTDFLASLSIQPYKLPFEIPFIVPGALQVFFFGAGAILLAEVVIRLLIPVYRRHVLGTLIGSIVFFSLGLGAWKVIGPLILVAVGLSILLRGLFRRR